jgi:Fic family protein
MDYPGPYTWQRPVWPKFYYDIEALLKPLGQCRFLQGALLTKMGELGFVVRQKARAEVLIEETLKTAEIEGEHLDAAAVRSSVARRLGLDRGVPATKKDRQAEGVVDILLDATMNYKKALDPERVCGWHAALFPTGYSGITKIRVAVWRDDRSGPMRVVSGPIGRERIHYEAPPARRIESEMTRFFRWWEKSAIGVDGFLRAGIAHLWFVAIHPFDDGNGRIARALTEMALAQDETFSTRYYSLSSEIMSKRMAYYEILDQTNKGDGDITRWLAWFLERVSDAIIRSDKLLANVMLKVRFWNLFAQTPLKERQTQAINRLLDAGPGGFTGGLTNRKYAGMGHVSKATAQRELADLLKKGILLKNPSGGRSTSYDLCWNTLAEGSDRRLKRE